MITKSFTISGAGVQSIGAALNVTGVKAKAVQLVPASGNSNSCLLGGTEVTDAVGFPLPATQTTPLYLPYASIWTDLYDFDNMYVYVASGDKLAILYEQG